MFYHTDNSLFRSSHYQAEKKTPLLYAAKLHNWSSADPFFFLFNYLDI